MSPKHKEKKKKWLKNIAVLGCPTTLLHQKSAMFLKSFFITLHYSFYKRYFLICFLYSTVNFTTNNAHCQIAQSVERLQCVAVMESNASSTPSNDVHKRADSYKVRKYQNTKSKTQEHRSLRVTNYPFCKLGKFVNFAMFLFKTYGSI